MKSEDQYLSRLEELGMCMNCGVERVSAGELTACPSCGDLAVKAAGVEVVPILDEPPAPPAA